MQEGLPAMIRKLPTPSATIDDLYAEPGKAELVQGAIRRMAPTGGLPGYAGDEIYVSLRAYAKAVRRGRAFSDNKAFVVNLPQRKSFSPDAAYYVGSLSHKFMSGAPVFAVEVRSDNDYGPAAEAEMAQKRADYFVAGTAAVWDVDLYSDDVVRLYTRESPKVPQIFRRGEMAHAGSALPGWSMPVDQLFPDDEQEAT